MTADHLSYKRATTVSLMGLGIQAALALALWMYARIGADSAAMTGALAIALGLPIWIALALVFQQHKLERLEAMEAEAYAASSASQASVFEEAGADQRSQAIRLAWMHKWFLPAVSLVVAAAYIALGLLRYMMTDHFPSPDSGFLPPPKSGWAISLGVGAAVVGFIFARFVAGMAKQKAWALLHAGSAAAVSCTLVGGALAISQFIFVATKSDTLLRYLPLSLGIYMMALGAEMLISFVLNMYRPRLKGEYQRPAFDSRVLAFLAAPDRLAESISEAINYQIGFNVSSTWFYRLLARSVVSLVALGLLTLWAMSIFTVVRPHEKGLLFRNGRMVREVSPGLVIDLPWPWAHVERFPAEAVNELSLGTPKPTEPGPILWTNDHTKDETYMLVQPSVVNVTGEPDRARATTNASSDLNLLALEVPIHYVITDLEKYKRLTQDGPPNRPDELRHELLKAVASSVLMQYVATYTVDEILGSQRPKMAAEIREIVQNSFDALGDGGAGVRVIFAGVEGVHPAKTVAPAFEEVVAADQKRLAEIEKAEADSIKTLASVVGEVSRARSIVAELDELDRLKNAGAPAQDLKLQEQKVIDLIFDAGGEAAALLAEARAARWEKHLRARSRAASASGQMSMYKAAPGPFLIARTFEALRQATAGGRVYIVPSDNVRVRVNQEESSPVISAFTPSPPAN
jgi:regulator of protease activity HflC (stomatin/prohibitin superfamily)